MLDDLSAALGEPLTLRIDNGHFTAKDFFGWKAYSFSELCADLIGIEGVKVGDYPYWCIVMRDELNEFRILFPEKSGLFKDIVLTFAMLKDLRQITMKPYEPRKRPKNRKRGSKVAIYHRGARIAPKRLKLPKIAISGHVKDYTERLEAIKRVIEGIFNARPVGQPTFYHGYLL